MVFYTIYSIEKIYTEKPYFDIKYSVLYNQGSQDCIFQNKSSLKDVKSLTNFMLENGSIISTAEDNYLNYLKITADKSVNLTRVYQDEIALWNSHFYTNITMAKITETFLPKFITQLNQFKNTDAPAKYSKVKENYVKSFASEIKSYQLFDDYLKTNNSTANKLSNDFLSFALNYETMARNAFVEANNNNSSLPTDKENNTNQQSLQRQQQQQFVAINIKTKHSLSSI